MVYRKDPNCCMIFNFYISIFVIYAQLPFTTIQWNLQSENVFGNPKLKNGQISKSGVKLACAREQPKVIFYCDSNTDFNADTFNFTSLVSGD